MFTGIAVTLDVSVLAGLMACAGGLGALALPATHALIDSAARRREQGRAQDNLADLLRTEQFARVIDDVIESEIAGAGAGEHPVPAPANPHSPYRSEAMLHARLDHMREVQQIWGADARRGAIEQVAAIMRRSVRRGDPASGLHGDIVNTIEGDGFTILLRGAGEQDASAIARRLRRELARARIEGLSDNIRLTASFGVASRRMGESVALWRARAGAALRQARARGQDQIVEASVIEETKLLPPPSVPTGQTKVA